MDLYYTGLPEARYALETLLFLYAGTTVFLAGTHAVCPFGMADWLNRLRAFINYTVFLIKGLAQADLAKKRFPKQNKKKQKKCMNFYCFMCDYYVALMSALVLLKSSNLRITVVV